MPLQRTGLASIIILNYNGKELLGPCLSSIERQTYEHFEVIVVDNGSSDGSVDFLKEKYPWVNLVCNVENLGFCVGNNIGFEAAKGDYVVLLSNDTEVDERWLERLVETAESNPSIGIVGCKMLRLDQKEVIDAVGLFCDTCGFPLGRGTGELDRCQYDYVADVFSAVGAAMLIKRQVLEKVSFFDPKFDMLSEEVDLCWRARLAGFSVVINPFAIVYHKSAATFKKLKIQRSRTRYLSERNILRMLLKNYSGRNLFLRILPRYFSTLAGEMAMFLLVGRDLALADVKALMWNSRNFKDTWFQHRKVQQLRVIDDGNILSKMLACNARLMAYRKFGLRSK